MLKVTVILSFLCVWNCMVFSQFIFESLPSVCKYVADDEKAVFLPDTLWNITRHSFQILLSPCGRVDIGSQCNKGSAACILNLEDHSKSIRNAGKYFQYIQIENDFGAMELVLASENGDKCNDNSNYSVHVHFICDISLPDEPELISYDECTFHIRVLKSDCIVPCTTRIKGKLLDFRHLRKLPAITVNTGNRTFVIKYCGAATSCGRSGISACEITNNTNTLLGDVQSQHFVYNPDGHLLVRSHFGAKRSRKNVEIHMKCNWNAETTNEKYVQQPNESKKNYKFVVESAHGCIKLPLNCLVVSNEGYVYNFTKLYKINGYWEVKNVHDGSMYLNLCGALRVPFSNACPGHSQVCYYENHNQRFFNLGTIQTGPIVTLSDTVKFSFKDGSVCAVNSTYRYSTNIELSCSSIEKGPVLSSINDCTYNIIWETPVVCPQQVVSRRDCAITDLTGRKDLNNLYTASSKIHYITHDSYLKYSLCGPLDNCRNYTNVSMCYVVNNREHVAGWLDKKLTSVNGMLKFNLVGEQCTEDIQRMVNVYLHCNYSVPKSDSVITNMIVNECLIELNIQTSSACLSQSVTDCRAFGDKTVVDLSPLALKDNNYIVRDYTDNIDYILNVCQQVVNNGEVSCPPESSSCLRNLTQPHLKHRFVSLGRMKGPILKDNEVIIKNDFGTFCSPLRMYSTTVIHFYCSEQEELPKLFKKDACSYEFHWNTVHACPKTVYHNPEVRSVKNCSFFDDDSKKFVDLTYLSKKSFEIIDDENNTYKFNFCHHDYSKCIPAGYCRSIKSERKFIEDGEGQRLEYKLSETCNNLRTVNVVNVIFKCDPVINNDHFVIDKIKSCKLNVHLWTRTVCTEEDLKMNSKPGSALTELSKKVDDNQHKINLVEKEVDVTAKHQHSSISQSEDFSLDKSMSVDCILRNNETQFSLSLKEFEPLSIVSSSKINYTVDLNKVVPLCQGLICKNSIQMAAPRNECPIVQYEASIVKLFYSGTTICDNGPYHSEIWLKCNLSRASPKIVEESRCNIVLEYPTKRACLLLEKLESHPSNAAVAAISSSAVVCFLLIVAIVVYLSVKRHLIRCPKRSQRILDNKRHVPVYYKDGDL